MLSTTIVQEKLLDERKSSPRVGTLLISPRNPAFSAPFAMESMVTTISSQFPIRFYITTTEQQRISIIADDLILNPFMKNLVGFLKGINETDTAEFKPCLKLTNVMSEKNDNVDSKLSEIDNKIFRTSLMRTVCKTNESVIAFNCPPNLDSKSDKIQNFENLDEFIKNLILAFHNPEPVHVILPIYAVDKIVHALQPIFKRSLPSCAELKYNLTNNIEYPRFIELIDKIVLERIKTSLRIHLKGFLKNFRTTKKSLSKLAEDLGNKCYPSNEEKRNEVINIIKIKLDELFSEMKQATLIYFQNEFPLLVALQMISQMHYPFRDEAEEIFELMGVLCKAKSFGISFSPVRNLSSTKDFPVKETEKQTNLLAFSMMTSMQLSEGVGLGKDKDVNLNRIVAAT